MKTYVLAGFMLGGLTVPALAQDYYVVRDPDTQDCQVVESTTTERPRGILGRVFRNRVEAERQTTVLCQEEARGPVVIERDRDPVVIERERPPVVIERERPPVVIERDNPPVVIERD